MIIRLTDLKKTRIPLIDFQSAFLIVVDFKIGICLKIITKLGEKKGKKKCWKSHL